MVKKAVENKVESKFELNESTNTIKFQLSNKMSVVMREATASDLRKTMAWMSRADEDYKGLNFFILKLIHTLIVEFNDIPTSFQKISFEEFESLLSLEDEELLGEALAFFRSNTELLEKWAQQIQRSANNLQISDSK